MFVAVKLLKVNAGVELWYEFCKNVIALLSGLGLCVVLRTSNRLDDITHHTTNGNRLDASQPTPLLVRNLEYPFFFKLCAYQRLTPDHRQLARQITIIASYRALSS